MEQDIEIGRQSAVEAERQLPLLRDRNVDRYLNEIIGKLAAQAPGARYPYAIKAVNASEINAFSLPGGPMYVNRGLFEAARNEAELAGVLAHEMSHVALRHGTHQASKAYLSQAGLGILGGLLGKNGGNTATIVNAIGGLGLNTVFLKFGRDAEYQADQLGAEIMAAAGYNPVAMADFFELLRREQGRDPGKLQRLFSDHPPSADREARIRDQAGSLQLARSSDVGGFDRMRADLRGLSPAPSQVAQRGEEPRSQDSRDNPDSGRYDVRVDEPSSRFQRFEQRNGFFTIEYPENWRAYASESGQAVSLAPDGGVVETRNGQQAMLYGVIVNHYAPFEDGSGEHRAQLRAPGGQGPVAGESGRGYRRPRRHDHPLQHVPQRRERIRTTRADRRSFVLFGGAHRTLAGHGAGGESDGRDPGPLRWPCDLRPVHRPRQRLRLDGADLHAHAADAERQR